MATARPMMLHCDSCCQVHLRLLRCTAAASAVATDFLQRFCVAGRSMFDEASACDSRRVRMPTYALMHTLPLCSPLFARTCCRCRPRIDRQRWSDRLAVAELMRARHCSVESDAVGPCRHGAHGGFTLALPSPLCFCSMQTCMSKTLCMCFAAAVLVMSVSSRTCEKPLGLALTS